MEAQFTSKYHTFFRQLTGCEISVGEDGVTVGDTRTCELADFVDTLMEDWTNQTDKDIAPFFSNLPPAEQLALLLDRFCTYREFEQLHTSRQSPPYDAVVFRLLAINDAAEHNKNKKIYPPDREGYFKLMEVLQPQLRTFFFPTVQGIYPAVRVAKACVPCRGDRVGQERGNEKPDMGTDQAKQLGHRSD